jgi:hypothetical protein
MNHFQVFYANGSSAKVSFPSNYTLQDVQLETGAEDVFFIFEDVML